MRFVLSLIVTLTISPLFSQNWYIGGIITICEGETVTIDAGMLIATGYLWSNGATTSSITVSPTTTTTYTVQIFVPGEPIVDSSTVYVLNVSAGENDTICGGETAYFVASGGLFYQWYPEEGLSNLTNYYTSVTTDTNVTYYCNITSPGPNLIYNGDFELGNTGFFSQYIYNNTSLWDEGTYMVGPNPQTYHSHFSSCPDHTTGTGNHMIINGAIQPNTTVWQQVLQVVPHTDYIFSCWAQTVCADNGAQLQFRINFSLIGPVFVCSDTLCHWTQFYTIWNSGTSTSANISIVNQNQGLGGNDFSIDDIFFSELKMCVDSVSVIVENPQMDLGSDTVICEGEFVMIQPTEEYSSYYWSTGATTPSIMIVAEGDYWCQGWNNSNCVATDTIHIAFKPQPFIDLLCTDSLICEGEFTRLYVESNTPVSLIWSNGEVGDEIEVRPASTTTYSVIASADGCLDTAQIEIEVVPYQTLFLGVDDYLCEGDELLINLDSLEGEFLWSTDDVTSTLLITEPGLYWVFVDDRGCVVSDTIEFRECSEISVPNIFTPNGDQINDYFCPETKGIDTLVLLIFDRWGKQVFRTEDFKTGWDGEIGGTPAPEGQYYWAIYYVENRTGNVRTERNLHGSLILAR
jgi:gliding motility-associated-like protein